MLRYLNRGVGKKTDFVASVPFNSQADEIRPTCHARMLLSIGAPVTPDGGSFWSRRKSRINRRLAGVDILGSTLRANYFNFYVAGSDRIRELTTPSYPGQPPLTCARPNGSRRSARSRLWVNQHTKLWSVNSLALRKKKKSARTYPSLFQEVCGCPKQDGSSGRRDF